MGTASLVTAALPIPVRSLHLIPAFASQEKFMNTYTSMSCFLVFAYVFYSRHALARWMFARRGEHFALRFWVSVLPVLLICCSIGCAIAYHHELGEALDALAAAGARLPSSVLLSKIVSVTAFTFWSLRTFADILWMIPLMGFSQLALFGGYSIYLPELFPTRLRSTGISFCYNVGRFVAAIGPLALGMLTSRVYADKLEPMRYAGVTMSLVFLVGLAALPFAPETKGKPLPE
jgi:ABC-type proline/glycine betaine transport system permease subunit